MAGVKNLKIFVARISFKNKRTGIAATDMWVASRSFARLGDLVSDPPSGESEKNVLGILREMDGFGQEMGEVMAGDKYGSIVLDGTRGSTEHDKRFYDRFQNETCLHQSVICYSAEMQYGVQGSIASDWEVEFSGEVSFVDIDTSGKKLTLSLKSKEVKLDSPNFQITREAFPDCSDESSGRFLPLIFGESIVPLYFTDTVLAEEGFPISQHFGYATIPQGGFVYELADVNEDDDYLIYFDRGNEGYRKMIVLRGPASTTVPQITSGVSGSTVLTAQVLSNDENRDSDIVAFNAAPLVFAAGEPGLIVTAIRVRGVGYNDVAKNVTSGEIKVSIWSSDTNNFIPSTLLGEASVDAAQYQSSVRASGNFDIILNLNEPIFIAQPRDFPSSSLYYVWVGIQQTNLNDPTSGTLINTAFKFDGGNTSITDSCYFKPSNVGTFLVDLVAYPGGKTYNFGVFCVAGQEADTYFSEGMWGFVILDPTERLNMQNLKMLIRAGKLLDTSGGTITGSSFGEIKRADHVIKLLYYLSNGNSLTGLDTTTFNPGDYAPDISGATEGRRTYRDIMIEVMENAAMKLVPRRSTDSLALWAYGISQDIAAVITESDCRLESITIAGEDGIVNRVRVNYGRSGVPLDLANQQQGQKNYIRSFQADDTLSQSLYGIRDLSEDFVELNWIGDEEAAERWAEYKLAMYAPERMRVTFTVPFWKENYRSLDLMDIIRISHIDLPSEFGSNSASNERIMTTEGVTPDDDFNLGDVWRRCMDYKLRILGRRPKYSINSEEAEIQFTCLVLDNPGEKV